MISNEIYKEATRTNKWFSQFAGYKINTQNQFYFYIPPTKKQKLKLENTNSYIKNIGKINTTKDAKDLYLENYKTTKDCLEKSKRPK